ncbi:2-C-methyl-D-erythritol 4-phosphate cytidylyltransferase [bacterium]|jgi:2-C-methyl-D-erythritol 4-phosphate cytidylyltransferase|nr:2-C-methyl-D-erythritol 4-phosphate cytidylyltransferase [bacterium]
MNTAIIAGGGTGRRFGGSECKQFVKIKGKPLIYYSICPFQESPFFDEIIVVLPPGHTTAFKKDVLDKFRFDKVVKVIPGGKERQDSVFNALNSVSGKTELVAVHDAARPFVTGELIEKLVKSMDGHDGVIPGVKILQTVKQIDKASYVVTTLDRDFIVEIQTPQVFKYRVLKKAYEHIIKNRIRITDDSAAVELAKGKIKITEGDYANRKITYKEDLIWMEIAIDRRL